MELEELTNFLKKFSKNKNKNSKKRILCDVLGSGIPIYIYNICIFTITMNRFGYGIDYQITSNHSKLKRMYSFNAIKFHEPTKYSIFKFLPKILLLNMRSLPNFFDMDKLFNMYIGDIYIGDLIYDSYTRYEKKSTVDNINFRYFKKINEAFFYCCYYTAIFKNNQYEYTVINHNCYIKNALLGRVANEYNSKVILFSGSFNGTLARKLYPNNAIFNFYSILNKDLFNKSILDNALLTRAQLFYDRVMNGDLETYDSINFNAGKVHTNYIEKKRIEKYKKDGKKIIVISAHVFTDNLVGADGRRQVYRDIFRWTKETLILCNRNDNIITYLKPHPRENAKESYPTLLHLYNSLELEHVKLWPNDVYMKDNSDLIDAIITIRGSVSFEFPGFGVPVVLAGKNHAGVSGLNTVIEVDDISKYENIIANIHTLRRLDDEAIKKNKLVYFMYFNSIFYNLIDELKFSKEDLFKDECMNTDPKQLPSNPYKDNVEDLIIEKLGKFFSNDGGYSSDLKSFLHDDSLNLFGEVQYKKTFLRDDE